MDREKQIDHGNCATAPVVRTSRDNELRCQTKYTAAVAAAVSIIIIEKKGCEPQLPINTTDYSILMLIEIVF